MKHKNEPKKSTPTRERRKTKCPDCLGKGWTLDNREVPVHLGNDYGTIERCDACCRYDGDIAACLAFFASKEGKASGLVLSHIALRKVEA